MIISNRGTAQKTVGEDEQGSCSEKYVVNIYNRQFGL